MRIRMLGVTHDEPEVTMDDIAYKTAAINWLLTVAEIDDPWKQTSDVLIDLAERGIDYEASTMPDFSTVTIDHGDTDTAATFGRGFAATIVPLNARREGPGRVESYGFALGEAEMMTILLGHVIKMVVSAAVTGDQGWKDRFPRERAMYEQMKADDAARLAAREAALAARDA
jgi:hypothetical protein